MGVPVLKLHFAINPRGFQLCAKAKLLRAPTIMVALMLVSAAKATNRLRACLPQGPKAAPITSAAAALESAKPFKPKPCSKAALTSTYTTLMMARLSKITFTMLRVPPLTSAEM